MRQLVYNYIFPGLEGGMFRATEGVQRFQDDGEEDIVEEEHEEVEEV